jgi:hypothetical protein
MEACDPCLWRLTDEVFYRKGKVRGTGLLGIKFNVKYCTVFLFQSSSSWCSRILSVYDLAANGAVYVEIMREGSKVLFFVSRQYMNGNHLFWDSVLRAPAGHLTTK